jgi:diguanylate cyclase (GGDEF)-like protein
MQAPARHPRELERQDVLDDMDILDTPMDPYIDLLTRVTRDIFKVDTVLVSLIDRDRQWFKSRAGAVISCTTRSISFCGHAILQDETMVVENATTDDRFADNPLVTASPNLRFYAGHPLHAPNGLPIGTLCLLHPVPRVFSRGDRGRLKDFAKLVEGYIRLRNLSEQTRRLRDTVTRERRKALLDPLTQLWNRAALDHFYAGERESARQNQELIGVLFVDLDRFKNINDQHGHGVGDQVLVETAHRLGKTLRGDDLLLRFGGEEFVVIARVKSAAQLKEIAERSRLTLAAQPFSSSEGEIAVTASFGATCGTPDDVIEALLTDADQALYRAKNAGRNCVIFSEKTAT